MSFLGLVKRRQDGEEEQCLTCRTSDPSIQHTCERASRKRKLSSGVGCCSKWYIEKRAEELNWSFQYFFGDPDLAAVYVPNDVSAALPLWTSAPTSVDVDYIISCLDEGLFTAKSLSECLKAPTDEFWDCPVDDVLASVDALTSAARIYEDLPDSTLDIEITSKPLNQAKWFTKASSTLAQRFSCISMFEHGGLDIDPDELRGVIALSTGNSLFMAAQLLHDPWHIETHARTPIIHTIGNVGKAGVCFLVSPRNPLIQQPARGKWRLVRHTPFDGRLESDMTDTTLHLSFTGYEFPLRTTDSDTFDKEALFIGAAVRAFEGREWVADLDLLAAFSPESMVERLSPCCHLERERQTFKDLSMTSVNSWIEFLDAPTTPFVVCAKDNWISRLALYSVAIQTRRPLILAFDWMCWLCVKQIAEAWTEGVWPSDLEKCNDVANRLMVLC